MYVLKCKCTMDRDLYNKVNLIYLDSFEQHLRIAQHKIKHRIKTGKYLPVLFKKEEQLVGFAYIVNPRINLYHIDFIAIDKMHRGCGAGLNAMNLLIGSIPKNSVLTLECEDKLVGFYQKFGFKLAPYAYSNYPVKLNFMIRTSPQTSRKSFRFSDYSNIVASFNGIGNNSASVMHGMSSQKNEHFNRHEFSALDADINDIDIMGLESEHKKMENIIKCCLLDYVIKIY